MGTVTTRSLAGMVMTSWKVNPGTTDWKVTLVTTCYWGKAAMTS
ncbi:hypothetical protein COMA1_11300 [Candidatus Nitrospira nitrosa]|uniref:Uncharacterized protein n=1 Tax=Candidatus Nitrospira nitrosa TaxID=1742972 RepID=A0A0S4LAN6_9BACT|nr:hypothetical protein COMA1_11300 [Candidatus Nitrospira nitrosa]